MNSTTDEKYRSMDREYVSQIVREYEYWTLCVNDNQGYLGRCYAWLVRPGTMQKFSDLTIDEMIELRQVLRDVEFALHALWQPDHMNYAWLGNFFHLHRGHGHMHIVPRYARSRWYRNRKYEDRNWGKNYAPSEEWKPDQLTLFAIRDDIRKAIIAA